MSHSPLMYGLIKLHSRLEGDLQKQKKNLEHVRAVIKIVEPDFDIASIKPKKTYKENPWFRRGEAFLVVLDVLREAREPLTLNEIAKGILAKRGVVNPTGSELRMARNTIKNTLDFYNGKTVKSVGRIRARRWSILSVEA